MAVWSFYPRRGAWKARRRRQQARRVKRDRNRRTNPQWPRGARGAAPTRARTSHAARASRESRAAARATPVHPGSAAAGTHIRNNRHVRLCACVRTRDVACAMARRVVSRDACTRVGHTDVTHTPRRRARQEGGGGPSAPPHHPRACVRADLRVRVPTETTDPASCDVAQLARAASPRDRAHLGRPLRREGGQSAVLLP